MQKILAVIGVLSLSGIPSAVAAGSVADILAENRTATADAAMWAGKSTLSLDYAYAGQGMTGTTASLEDVRTGSFVDSYAIGPTAGGNGYDGIHVWLKEPSGTVTEQGGGDSAMLAINESYRDANLWWRKDFGGATITDGGEKADAGQRYAVLTITPKGGKPFDAWFDANSHLLARTREIQGTLPITTFYSEYSPVDGVQIAHRQVVDDSTGTASRQTMTLTRAQFSPPRPASDFAPPAKALHDFTLSRSGRTTVPFRLINNHIYADVSVNGSKPLTFIFDTGGHDILTPHTATMLGVRSIGASTSTGGGDNVSTSGSARVQSIRVGEATLNDQPVSILQFDNPAEGVNEQGMIGYEFFARFATQIDYGRHTLTFIDTKSFDPRGAGIAVPFRFYGQFPEILGSYDGIPGRFGIDTGARTPLSLNRYFVEQNGLRAGAKSGVEALTGWGVGGPSRAFVMRGGMLRLGDLDIAHPLTELSIDHGGADASEAFPNNVGGGVLKRFVVTLDYAHYRIFFKPVDGLVADLDTFDRSGMWINAQHGGFEIVDVTKAGPAEQAGLKKGDVITAVDGKPVSSLTLYDLRRTLRNEAPGTIVHVSVRTMQGDHAATLTLRDQI
ncbi:MAG TPA: aspartyl protease family protein [Rhizomicrobium sp.]